MKHSQISPIPGVESRFAQSALKTQALVDGVSGEMDSGIGPFWRWNDDETGCFYKYQSCSTFTRIARDQ